MSTEIRHRRCPAKPCPAVRFQFSSNVPIGSNPTRPGHYSSSMGAGRMSRTRCRRCPATTLTSSSALGPDCGACHAALHQCSGAGAPFRWAGLSWGRWHPNSGGGREALSTSSWLIGGPLTSGTSALHGDPTAGDHSSVSGHPLLSEPAPSVTCPRVAASGRPSPLQVLLFHTFPCFYFLPPLGEVVIPPGSCQGGRGMESYQGFCPIEVIR